MEIEKEIAELRELAKARVKPEDTFYMNVNCDGEIILPRKSYAKDQIEGEIYPCKPDIFEATYEAVL